MQQYYPVCFGTDKEDFAMTNTEKRLYLIKKMGKSKKL